jgi:HPt (histidine-containing phosphotransfer) domain-containing protein
MKPDIDALKLRFRERCSSDLVVLQQMLRAPETVSPTVFKTLVHQMSGAAGAFGFSALSALAMRLDDQLSDGKPPSREQVQGLIDALRAL